MEGGRGGSESRGREGRGGKVERGGGEGREDGKVGEVGG